MTNKDDPSPKDRSTNIGKDATKNVIVPGDNNKIVVRIVESKSDLPDACPQDPRKYLLDLQANTAFIDIRGLQVGSGKATRFPIDDLYIPLTTVEMDRQDALPSRSDPLKARSADFMAHTDVSRRVELHEMLRHRKLVVVGDPGAGKTTFVRRMAAQLCRDLLGEDPGSDLQELALDDRPLPIFIRVSELLSHIAKADHRQTGPFADDAPRWIPHFLATMCVDCGLELDERFFQTALDGGACLVIFDGLDEAATEQQRRSMSRLAEQASNTYGQCRFVVTTRPAAYKHEVVLSGFTEVRVDSLEKEAIDTFLTRWCEALFPENPRRAQQHLDELLHALRSRVEIRRMARNPVMLTALAVMYWNEKRIPEQRADLYQSVIGWLSRARERSQGRLSPERCVSLLQKLALAMQNHPDGRQVQVTRHWAAHAIAPQWRELPEDERAAVAEQFLSAEELDSGIIVGRGDHLCFWHLTFQEFLAARALAALVETEQLQILHDQDHLYTPEWKEVALLLAGVLYHQGIDRVDRFVFATIDQLGKKPTLANQALCVGLLGAAVHDLSPVGYQPQDDRYQQLLRAVLGVFETSWYDQAPHQLGMWSRLVGALSPKLSRAMLIDVAIKAADALGQATDPRFSHANRQQNWITIGPGEFVMGETGKSVKVDKFQIGRYPVTVGEYRHFVEHDGYQDDQWWGAGGLGEYTEPDDWEDQLIYPTRPVVGVSWYEAMAYAAFEDCRLPTEQEWEFAARGTDGREYPWGNNSPDVSLLNFSEGKIGHPTPVGVYPLGATKEGVCDMAGSIWEWCDSVYSQQDSEYRVLRGGAFSSNAQRVRSAFRNAFHPVYRSNLFGFRVARTYT